jgi:Raf kinase inhibitor-like YbhB/YbcL family protein
MDANGYTRAALSDDGAKPIGLSTSNGKAAAVLTFKASTRELAARLQSDKQFSDQYAKDPRFHFSPGGIPLYKQGKFVALIAVGGARNIDEDCARDGVKTLAWATTEATPASSTPPTMGHADKLVLAAIPANTDTRLKVLSPAFANGSDIPLKYTQYGKNVFPGLAWTGGPKGTRSYVVIMQGENMSGMGTSIHLTLYNVPVGVTGLPAGMTTPPGGAVYGPNVHGLNQPYAGPHNHTSVKQRYHLQVFAVDTLLPSDPNLSFEALQTAMTGHVLASGEMVGQAAKPANAAE